MSIGQKPDLVTAIGLCRGDQKQDACRNCLNQTMSDLEQSCPTSREAVGWWEFCMVHYANREIFGKLTTGPHFPQTFGGKSNGTDQFNDTLNSLLNNVISRAAAGGSLLKYAADNANAADNATGIYALVQCTPDLSQQDCSDCLTTSMGKIPDFCNTTGCRIVTPSCNLRFQTDPIITPTTSSTPSNPAGEGKRNNVTISVPVTTILLLIILGICIYLRSTRNRRENVEVAHQSSALLDFTNRATNSFSNKNKPGEGGFGIVQISVFDFETIKRATNNFSNAKKLGEGGFGEVYKGTLDGRDIAVKKLSSHSRQGESEFKHEIASMITLQHNNLVKLLGYCSEGNERLLIYEFVANGSLDRFILDSDRRAELNWETCYRIILGIAKGLLYLHEESLLNVIHRDLKAANILLYEDKNPKIADFGLARLFLYERTHDTTKKVAGTLGYMAPEYYKFGQYSVKSDVFSFGVLILEIVRGKLSRMEKEGHIIIPVWENWGKNSLPDIVDSNLRDSSDEIMMNIRKCIHIGLLCVEEDANQRPDMSKIVWMLTNLPETLPSPSSPAFVSTN